MKTLPLYFTLLPLLCAACQEEKDTGQASIQYRWYQDADGDGYGDPEVFSYAEDPVAGAVSNGDDCDDSDPAVNPIATEICDGVDQDCDGMVDEGLLLTWYLDADGDGWGLDGTTAAACTLPDGYAASGDDCDDTDAAINPDAEEVCFDGLDNDCDGQSGDCVLSGDLEVGAGAATFRGDAGDYLTGAGTGAGDVDGDGVPDIAVVAMYAESDLLPTGRVAVFSGALRGEHGLADAQGIITGDADTSYLGVSNAGGGDLNQDGYDDLLLQASLTTDPSETWLVFGPISGTNAVSDVGARLHLDGSGDTFFGGVATGGDYNGDGATDALVMAYAADYTYTLYLAAGPITGDVDLGDPSASLGPITGSPTHSVAGAGDVNGDGLHDVLVASPGSRTVYMVYAPFDALMDVADVPDVLYSDMAPVEEMILGAPGQTVAGAGDTNGDGYDDLLIGDYLAMGIYGAGNGLGLLVHGPVSGRQALVDADLVILPGEEAGQHIGWSLAGGGDLNGDGLDEILVGPLSSEESSAALLFYGPTTGTVSFDEAETRFVGAEGETSVGGTVAFVGDLDQDGYDDFLLSGSGNGTEGAAYLWLGGGL